MWFWLVENRKQLWVSRCTNTGSKEGLDNVAAAPTKQDKKRNKRAKKDGSCIEGNYNLKKKKKRETSRWNYTLPPIWTFYRNRYRLTVAIVENARPQYIGRNQRPTRLRWWNCEDRGRKQRAILFLFFFFAFLLLKERKKVEYQYCCLAVASAHVRFSVCVFFFLHSFSAVIIDTVLCSQAAHADLSVL